MQVAIVAAGMLAWLAAIPLLLARSLDRSSVTEAKAPLAIPLRSLLTPTGLGLVAFFALLSLSTGPLTNFSIVALVSLYDVTLSTANAALTAFLLSTALVLAGGFIADATHRHGDVAAVGFAGAALLVATIGTVYLGPVLLAVCMGAAGFLAGMIAPSRDMLVRAAAPPGALRPGVRIVTTGFNIGGDNRSDVRRLDHGPPASTPGVLRIRLFYVNYSSNGAEHARHSKRPTSPPWMPS